MRSYKLAVLVVAGAAACNSDGGLGPSGGGHDGQVGDAGSALGDLVSLDRPCVAVVTSDFLFGDKHVPFPCTVTGFTPEAVTPGASDFVGFSEADKDHKLRGSLVFPRLAWARWPARRSPARRARRGGMARQPGSDTKCPTRGRLQLSHRRGWRGGGDRGTRSAGVVPALRTLTRRHRPWYDR